MHHKKSGNVNGYWPFICDPRELYTVQKVCLVTCKLYNAVLLYYASSCSSFLLIFERPACAPTDLMLLTNLTSTLVVCK